MGRGKGGSERRRRRGKEEQTNGCVHRCRWAGVQSRGGNTDPYEVVNHTERTTHTSLLRCLTLEKEKRKINKLTVFQNEKGCW